MKKFAFVMLAVSAIALYTCMSLMAHSYQNTYVEETQLETRVETQAEEYYTDEELLELGIWKEDFTVRVEE